MPDTKQCEALNETGDRIHERCRKPAATVVAIAPRPRALCASHHGVFLRGGVVRFSRAIEA